MCKAEGSSIRKAFALLDSSGTSRSSRASVERIEQLCDIFVRLT